MPAKADLLLVTVNDHETHAVLEVFKKLNGQSHSVQIEKRVYRDLGPINGTKVFHALSEMGSGGLGAAHVTVNKAISALSPQAVIAVGIAFGVDEGKQQIGEILLSKQLLLYESQRVGPQTTTFRGDRAHASAWLLNYFQSAALNTWNGARVKSGLLFSGEKLLDNIDYLKELRAQEPSAIGGEMEGAGLYTASHEEKVDWIVIKAICDWADGNKSKDKDNRQQQAAHNAAEFVIHALQQVPLIESAPAVFEPAVTKDSKLGASPVQASSARMLFSGTATEADRDIYLDECFETIASGFAERLAEVERIEAGVQTKFKQIDTNRFSAVIYHHGTAKARCKIVIGGGGMGKAITYSTDDDPGNNSINEYMNVEADKNGLHLKCAGMQHLGSPDRSRRLNGPEAAAYFWDLFTRFIR